MANEQHNGEPHFDVVCDRSNEQIHGKMVLPSLYLISRFWRDSSQFTRLYFRNFKFRDSSDLNFIIYFKKSELLKLSR